MKSPKVSIYSLKELYQQDYADAVAIISVSGPNSVQTDKLNGLHYLLLEYRDVDYPDVPGSFSAVQANAAADLIRALPRSVERIFCVCEAGISRSAALAAALSCYYKQDEMLIWRNPSYSPNIHVYELLRRALGIPVTEDELEFRFRVNQNAFRAAIKNAHK